MGFLNQDSLLDERKIEGLKTLKLPAKEIKNIEGLQYFKQVSYLDISNNKIEELKNLPPNLTRLECSNNLIKKITNLPDNLEFLNFSNNLVKSFPIFPSSLQIINYFNNPLDINSFPELYKNNIPCDHPDQNCLPYELANWKLLNNNIKDTVFEILALNVTINVSHGWGLGDEIRKLHFIKKGAKLICNNENIYVPPNKYNKEPINKINEKKCSTDIEELKLFLKDLYNKKMIFEFQINDRLETVDLRTKRNGDPSCSSCIDCSSYDYKYEIYTTKNTIVLNYHYANENRIEICGNYIIEIIDGNLVPYTKDRPEDIRAILNSLYINKLERIILNRKYDFNDFEEIIKWEKNYK